MSAAQRWVTDGGLETDLIFHHGVDLPEFAAYPLLQDAAGRALLTDYYQRYAEIAECHQVGLRLETPTWRANPDWGARLGHDRDDLDRFNTEAIGLLSKIAARHPDLTIELVGMIGPRGDGYQPGSWRCAEQARDYHLPQVISLSKAGAHRIAAYTLCSVTEAVGIVGAARAVALPVDISFTVEPDGRLADGTELADAVLELDAQAAPDHILVNCCHPSHVMPALLRPGDWQSRLWGLRPNASRASHAELDAAPEIDEGDPDELAAAWLRLARAVPSMTMLGGCCGTDHRHVARMWQAWTDPPPR